MSQSVTQSVWVNFVERVDLVWRWARTLYGITNREGIISGPRCPRDYLSGNPPRHTANAVQLNGKRYGGRGSIQAMVSSVSSAILGPRLQIPMSWSLGNQGWGNWSANDCSAGEWVRFWSKLKVPKITQQIVKKVLKRKSAKKLLCSVQVE